MSTVSVENIDKWSSIKIQIEKTQERLDFLRSLPTNHKLAVFYAEGDSPMSAPGYVQGRTRDMECTYCGRIGPDLWSDTMLEVDAAYVVAKPIAECEQRIEELTKQLKELETP